MRRLVGTKRNWVDRLWVLGGKLVDRLLQDETKLPRTSTHLTNAALCRGDNEDDFAQAAKCCAPRLLREIHQFENPLHLSGSLPRKVFPGLGKILFIRGFVKTAPSRQPHGPKGLLKAPLLGFLGRRPQLEFEILYLRSKMARAIVLRSIHPAFVLRSETWHRSSKPISEGLGGLFETQARDSLTSEPMKSLRELHGWLGLPLP